MRVRRSAVVLEAGELGAPQADRSAGRWRELHDRPAGRRLPAARLADQTERLALGQVEADVGHRVDASAVPAGELDRQVLDPQHQVVAVAQVRRAAARHQRATCSSCGRTPDRRASPRRWGCGVDRGRSGLGGVAGHRIGDVEHVEVSFGGDPGAGRGAPGGDVGGERVAPGLGAHREEAAVQVAASGHRLAGGVIARRAVPGVGAGGGGGEGGDGSGRDEVGGLGQAAGLCVAAAGCEAAPCGDGHQVGRAPGDGPQRGVARLLEARDRAPATLRCTGGGSGRTASPSAPARRPARRT